LTQRIVAWIKALKANWNNLAPESLLAGRRISVIDMRERLVEKQVGLVAGKTPEVLILDVAVG
jgi:hypothetical protein